MREPLWAGRNLAFGGVEELIIRVLRVAQRQHVTKSLTCPASPPPLVDYRSLQPDWVAGSEGEEEMKERERACRAMPARPDPADWRCTASVEIRLRYT